MRSTKLLWSNFGNTDPVKLNVNSFRGQWLNFCPCRSMLRRCGPVPLQVQPSHLEWRVQVAEPRQRQSSRRSTIEQFRRRRRRLMVVQLEPRWSTCPRNDPSTSSSENSPTPCRRDAREVVWLKIRNCSYIATHHVVVLLLVLILIVVRATCSKKPKRRRFKSDWDEIGRTVLQKLSIDLRSEVGGFSIWHHTFKMAAMTSFYTEKCCRLASKYEACAAPEGSSVCQFLIYIVHP